MKEVFDTKILLNEQISDGIFKMEIAYSDCNAIIPGQFVNVYINDKSLLLTRPISICEVMQDAITLVYMVVGKGTNEMSKLIVGDIIKVSSPLGNGYDLGAVIDKNTEIAVFGGGVGIPPMLLLVKSLIKNGNLNISVVLGFKEETFLIGDFANLPIKLYVASESKNKNAKIVDVNISNRNNEYLNGNVLELAKQENIAFSYGFACGPKPMLSALSAYFLEKNIPIQISMEERMGCGYGACVGCVCDTRSGKRKVCSDGPVFMGDEVIWNG